MRYKNMVATTNDPFDPTLRAITQTVLPDGVNSVLEIVLDGTDAPSIEAAMRAGIPAACRPGVNSITAANFGGELGPPHFHPRQILGRGRAGGRAVPRPLGTRPRTGRE